MTFKTIRIEPEDLPDPGSYWMTQWRAKGRLTGGKFKRCQDPGFAHRWEVRIYLAGVGQHLIAYAPCGSRVPVGDAATAGMRAARFADMAALHFAAYRRRVEPLSDLDMNFSLAQAKADLDGSPQLKHLLTLMTNQLRDAGFIPERRDAKVSLHGIDKQLARLCVATSNGLADVASIVGETDPDVVSMRAGADVVLAAITSLRKKVRMKVYEEPEVAKVD